MERVATTTNMARKLVKLIQNVIFQIIREANLQNNKK